MAQKEERLTQLLLLLSPHRPERDFSSARGLVVPLRYKDTSKSQNWKVKRFFLDAAAGNLDSRVQKGKREREIGSLTACEIKTSDTHFFPFLRLAVKSAGSGQVRARERGERGLAQRWRTREPEEPCSH